MPGTVPHQVANSRLPGSAPADYFIRAEGPLRPDHAVAALLVLEDGRYVMQLRDVLPHIFYPDHWGCFGGALAVGETPVAALRRELDEELEFTPSQVEEFTRFEFDFSGFGQPKVVRIYYELTVTAAAFGRFVLHEGAACEAVGGRELLTQRKVTPYDAFAIWMHMSRHRFEPDLSERGT
jgi:8-oxo-dGTP pyrophosphatase MutT (NUDIX family)